MGKDACQIPFFCVCSQNLAVLKKKYEALEKLHSSPSQTEEGEAEGRVMLSPPYEIIRFL